MNLCAVVEEKKIWNIRAVASTNSYTMMKKIRKLSGAHNNDDDTRFCEIFHMNFMIKNITILYRSVQMIIATMLSMNFC